MIYQLYRLRTAILPMSDLPSINGISDSVVIIECTLTHRHFAFGKLKIEY